MKSCIKLKLKYLNSLIYLILVHHRLWMNLALLSMIILILAIIYNPLRISRSQNTLMVFLLSIIELATSQFLSPMYSVLFKFMMFSFLPFWLKNTSRISVRLCMTSASSLWRMPAPIFSIMVLLPTRRRSSSKMLRILSLSMLSSIYTPSTTANWEEQSTSKDTLLRLYGWFVSFFSFVGLWKCFDLLWIHKQFQGDHKGFRSQENAQVCFLNVESHHHCRFEEYGIKNYL